MLLVTFGVDTSGVQVLVKLDSVIITIDIITITVIISIVIITVAVIMLNRSCKYESLSLPQNKVKEGNCYFLFYKFDFVSCSCEIFFSSVAIVILYLRIAS